MLGIERINTLYSSVEDPVQIYEVPMFDGDVRRYMFKLRELRNDVGELSQHEAIRPLFRLFYAVQRCLTSTFLTADLSRFDYSPVVLGELESKLFIIECICNHRLRFEALLNEVFGFQTKVNCLVETFKQYSGIAMKSGNKCCYVPAPRLFNLQLIENETRKDFPGIDVKSLGQLRSGLPLYDCMFLAGPRCWYSDFSYLFDGSRARQVYFMHYSWLARRMDSPCLSGLKKEISRPPNVQVVSMPHLSARNAAEPNKDEVLSEEDVFSAVKVQIQNLDDEEIGAGVTVIAKQFDLAGGYSVFLEERGSVRILDYSNGSWETPKIDVSRIRKGMYVLLRRGGDGDYVRATAEQLFNRPYNEYRRRLLAWKRELSGKIEVNGLDEVVSKLILLGSEKAKDHNVQNWSSLFTIKPQYWEDFAAVMTLLGRNDVESKKLWDEARHLINWHHQAGKKVAVELRNSITSFAGRQTEQLVKYGHVKVDLAIGASIDVFEVLGKTEDAEEKKYSQLNCPFSQES